MLKKNVIFRWFWFAVFLISFNTGYSQKVILTGTVNDSLQNPLSFANVIAKPKNISKNLQFAITDDEGFYKLVFQKGDTVTISISYLGYKPLNFEICVLTDAQST